MVRTLTISLHPTPEQAKALLDTMEAFNAACNFVSGIAWESRTFRHYDLRKLCYYNVRARFGLTAELAQHAIKKVADAYRVSKAKQAEFKPLGAVTYDARVLRLIGVSNVSMALLHGRETIRLSTGGCGHVSPGSGPTPRAGSTASGAARSAASLPTSTTASPSSSSPRPQAPVAPSRSKS